MISRLFIIIFAYNLFPASQVYSFDCGKGCIPLEEDVFFVKRNLKHPLLILSEVITVKETLLPRIRMFREAVQKKDIDTILTMHSEHFIDRKIYRYYPAMGIESRKDEYKPGTSTHLGEEQMAIRQKETQLFFKLWKNDIRESLKTGESKEKLYFDQISPYLLNLKRFQNKELAIVVTAHEFPVFHGSQYFEMRNYTLDFEDQLWFIVYFINKKNRENFNSLVFSLNPEGVYQIETSEIFGESSSYYFWAIEYDPKKRKAYLKKDL